MLVSFFKLLPLQLFFLLFLKLIGSLFFASTKYSEFLMFSSLSPAIFRLQVPRQPAILIIRKHGLNLQLLNLNYVNHSFSKLVLLYLLLKMYFVYTCLLLLLYV